MSLNAMAKTNPNSKETALNKHVHKYKRAYYKNRTPYYFCATPECDHRIDPELTLGKLAICWRCGNPFDMSPRSYRQDKPHCDMCVVSRTTKKRKADDISLVDQIGISIPEHPSDSISFADKRKSLFGRRDEDKDKAPAVAKSVIGNLKERLAALSGEIEVQVPDSTSESIIDDADLSDTLEVGIDDDDLDL